jgi:hypothetical protein
MPLYRVFTHTKGDESVSERVVEAGSEDEARNKAIANVKAQNLGKGEKTQPEAQGDTEVLSVHLCGKNGVLTINRIPLSIIQDLAAIKDIAGKK